MNLLFVNDIPFNPFAGGLERVTDVLVKELLKRGYTIYYLSAKVNSLQNSLLNYEYPVPLYQLPNYGLFENDGNITFYKNLQKELRIDVVINQRGIGGYFNSMLSITTTKLVSVIHSTPEGNILLYSNRITDLSAPYLINLKRIIKRSVMLPYWRKKAMKERKSKYNELAFYSDAIVTLSERCIGIMKSFIDIPFNARIISIPNPNTFNSPNVLLKQKQKTIIYVGRLTKLEKEPLRLLKIWKILHNNFPNWKLKIIGEGEEKENMRKYVENKRLNNVFFEGAQFDVMKYYKEASFVCLTSNFEGWGMVLTEGMQYGCIPFTFNNYGAAFDIIDDGLNGCLISAFDIKEYANRLSELMSNELKRLKMSKAAIDKVKKFSVEKVADKWEELFMNL